MSSAHTDLKAIQKKMRSLKHDRRVTEPTSPPPHTQFVADEESWNDLPGLEPETAIAVSTAPPHRVDPAATVQALRQRSQAPASAPAPLPTGLSAGLSTGLSTELSTGQSSRQSIGQSSGQFNSQSHGYVEYPDQIERMGLGQVPSSPLPQPAPSTVSTWVAVQQQQQQRQQLKALVQRVNQAAVEQETALLELCRLLQIVPPEIAADWDDPAAVSAGLTQPWIEQSDAGQWQLQSRLIDLEPDRHEAESMAQFLRNPPWRNAPTRHLRHRLRPLLGWLKRQRSPFRSQPGKSAERARFDPTFTPDGADRPDISFVDIAIWVAGAALVRFGFTALMASLAIPVPIAVGFGAVLVAIALYVGATQSGSGLTFVYRCVLIAIGLLLGGRIA